MNPVSLSPDLNYPPEPQRWPTAFPPACATAWGDDQYGLWIDVLIGGPLQRFRWIEPGEFVMGSPEKEEGRSDNEGPQHVVRLTEGFWLADTACTQAVWTEVMSWYEVGESKDLQNPVERVSWDRATDFLNLVEGLLPGMKAELPTEAEWEYTCRAGEGTPFSWGERISPDQANYDASVSFAGGPTGPRSGKAVPVKSIGPNAWGLYQMHGNVWEWCADGARVYVEMPQVNPRGETSDKAGAQRVVRGGSWIHTPHGLRAACRDSRPRGRCHIYQGFRFLLRHKHPTAHCPPEVVLTRDP